MAISYSSYRITKVAGVTKNTNDIIINGKTAKKINNTSRSFQYGWEKQGATAPLACAAPSFFTFNYSYDNSLSIGSLLYTNVNMNVYDSNGFYVNTVDDVIGISSGQILSIGVCSTSFYLFYDGRSCVGACAKEPDTFYYSADSTLIVGSYLWTDAALTTPASDGYYSDNSDCYYITDGRVASITKC